MPNQNIIQCGAIVQWFATWTPDPGVQPHGVRSKDEKYLWDALVSLTHTRKSEVCNAEPEIWRSPNHKRSITIQNAKRRTLNPTPKKSTTT